MKVVLEDGIFIKSQSSCWSFRPIHLKQ